MALTRLEAQSRKQSKIDDLLASLAKLAARPAISKRFLSPYADLLDRNGKGSDALEVRRRIAKDSPDDYLTRAQVAAEYERQGRTPDAIVFYEEVVRIAGVPTPVMSNYRLKLAALYEKNGQKQEAIGQYREVKKADAGNRSALEALKRLGVP